jgi:two-component system, cell cycle sensor histidine kinase and response regulator CckA
MIKILAVDDRDDNLVTISALLKNIIPDCMVLTARSGIEAIETAKTELPDTILLDIRMPQMDGFEVCQKLKDREDTKHIPILMFTAIHTDIKSRIKGLEIGADAFLTKPVDEAELAAQVRAMLRIKRAEDALRQQKNCLERLVQERTKQLSESEERYRLLFNRANDAVFVHHLIEGGIPDQFVEANDTACQMLGYSKEELLQLSILNINSPEKLGDVLSISGKLMTEEQVIFETVCITKGGQSIPVEISAHLFDFKGQPTVLSIVRAITERKRMEEELQKSRKLESLAIFAGGIAHDFNNLLTTIMGNLSLGKIYAQSESNALAVLTSAERACHQAKRLTRQLITFSKGGEPIKRVISISKLLRDAVPFALSGSRTRYELSLPDNLWWTEADEGQMNQVINNIMINADQAMPEGGIIEVCAENVIAGAKDGLCLKTGKCIKITIKDRGIGIPEKYLQKIFDPYFTTKHEGSGLGLAIAYSIINKHNGCIKVESEAEAGTTFHIYLPASERELFTVKDISEEKILHGQGKILFMDDQQGIRDTVREMLVYLGYKVEVAGDGSEAITLYKSAKESGQDFDVVILDLTVPDGMGGKEAIKKLRDLDPEVKAIVTSGYSHDPIMSEFKKYGFCGVVNKPYEIKEISKVLREVTMAGPHSSF